LKKNKFDEEEIYLPIGVVNEVNLYLKLSGNLLKALLGKLRAKNLMVKIRLKKEPKGEHQFFELTLERYFMEKKRRKRELIFDRSSLKWFNWLTTTLKWWFFIIIYKSEVNQVSYVIINFRRYGEKIFL